MEIGVKINKEVVREVVGRREVNVIGFAPKRSIWDLKGSPCSHTRLGRY